MWEKRGARKSVHHDTSKGSTAPVTGNYLDDYWPRAGRLSGVNAIGTQLRDPIKLGIDLTVVDCIDGRRGVKGE